MQSLQENLSVQKYIVVVAILLFLFKIAGWFITGSVAILTDGLESIVNVISGLLGFYSLRLAAKPRDRSHPYGHGKVEFISAGVEGTLITIAGIFIIYKAIQSFVEPPVLSQLDVGIGIVAISAVVNYSFGLWAVNTGRRNKSLALQASGRHLQTDTYTTIGIIAGLYLVKMTGQTWIDGAVAILFALFIIRVGAKIIRRAVAGIMDESDQELLKEMVDYLQAHRDPNLGRPS